METSPQSPHSKKNDGKYKKVANMLGMLGRIDIEDIDCSFNRNYVRIRVSMDVSKPLKRGFFLKKEGQQSIWIPFKFKRLTGFCFAYGMVGHDKDSCKNADLSCYNPSLYGQWLWGGNFGG